MVTVHGDYAHFSFFRPQTRCVSLVGDFNGWRSGELQMVALGDGYWVALLKLSPGSYKFRYCADGQWYTDYAAFGVEYGRFGPDGIVHILPVRGDEGFPDVRSREHEEWASQALLPNRAPNRVRAAG